jgi:hypothetical protein
VADESKNYVAAYVALIKKAHAVGNQRALDELTKVGPPPYSTGEGYGVQRKWSNEFEGADGFLRSTLGLPLVAPVLGAKHQRFRCRPGVQRRATGSANAFKRALETGWRGLDIGEIRLFPWIKSHEPIVWWSIR